MCFSATASFSSSAFLAATGCATLWKAVGWRQVPFASIPLLFAIQQFTEGLVWLGIPSASSSILGQVPTYAFLVFAQMAWPVWVPFSLLLLAKSGPHRLAVALCLVIGAAVAGCLGICLLLFGAHAEALSHHIHYVVRLPWRMTAIVGACYGLATIAPSFIAGVRHTWMLGLGILVSYILTSLIYQREIVSVWCYFSALLSVTIYIILSLVNDARSHSLAAPFPQTVITRA